MYSMALTTVLAYSVFQTLLVLMTVQLVIADNTTSISLGDKLRCLNESIWSSQTCRESVLITFRDEQGVRDRCGSLGMLNVTLEALGCGESDVGQLIDYLCHENWTAVDCLSRPDSLDNSTTSTTVSYVTPVNKTEEGRRARALDIMANEISTTCRDIMWSHAVNFTESLAIGCSLLEEASTNLISAGNCTQSDIDKLHPIVCNLVPKVTEFENKLNQALNETSDLCKTAVHQEMLKASNETKSCQLWEILKSERINNSACTIEELNLVTRAVCQDRPTTTSTAPPTTPTTLPVRRIIIDTMRDKILSFVDHDISSSCRWSVGARILPQLTDLRRLCKMFEQSGAALISNQICSTDEVMKLTGVFCHLNFHAGLRKVASTEEGRRAQAMDIMANELSPKCHSIMWPQVVVFEGSLAFGCNLLVNAAATLVSSGFCLQSDIDMLQPIVCYVEPRDPKLVQYENKLSQILSGTSDSCNLTVHQELVNATSELEACQLMTDLKTELLGSNYCTDTDIHFVTSALCSGHSSPSISNFVLTLCLLLYVFSCIDRNSTLVQIIMT